MVRIIWSKLALAELKLIKEFISLDSSFYAKNTILKIRNRFKVLKKQPNIGKIWENEHMEEYRELIEGKYRIFYNYNLEKNEVNILSVFHSSRDIESLII